MRPNLFLYTFQACSVISSIIVLGGGPVKVWSCKAQRCQPPLLLSNRQPKVFSSNHNDAATCTSRKSVTLLMEPDGNEKLSLIKATFEGVRVSNMGVHSEANRKDL
jgi:hypothetical protein